MPCDLEAELRCLSFETMPQLLQRAAPRWCAPGVYRVTAHIAGSLWTPNSWGEALHATPVFDGDFPVADSLEQMALCDLVAWLPSKPARWWLRTGAATLLGRQHLVWARQDQTPLSVFATPRAWVESGGDGICLLQPEALDELFGLTELRCRDVRVAQRIDAALRRGLPRVTVPRVKGPRTIA